MNKSKLLIIDDSIIIRNLLKSLFASDPDIDVTGEAQNGHEGLEKILTGDYDAVLLDYEMPEMTGLDVLKAVQEHDSKKDIPIIVFSALSKRGSEITIQCLMAGAKDYVLKPSKQEHKSKALNSTKQILKEKILGLSSEVNYAADKISQVACKKKITKKDNTFKAHYFNMVLIGASTGGPITIETVLKKLPKDFPLPILTVLHMPASFTTAYAQSLAKSINLDVAEVKDETNIKAGTVYIAAGGKHLTYNGEKLNSTTGEPVNFCIPSIDVLYDSIANNYRSGKVLSIILTGMGKDGTQGVKSLKSKGLCYSVVQDQASSVIWSMPKGVHEAGMSDEILPPDIIGDFLFNIGKQS